jgi:hypothetical protein
MNRILSGRCQRGYLYEIPMILLAVSLALALALPRLSVVGRKMALGVAAGPLLYGLFYLIVRPGWTVGVQRGPVYGRLALFLACAISVIVLVAGYIFAGPGR